MKTKVWRYMDLNKFYDIIDGNLYFSRADKFKDEFEGVLTNKNFEAYVDWMFDPRTETNKDKEELRRVWEKVHLPKKNKVAISCWHINENENISMWERYIEGNEGVAISSTVEQLSEINAPDGYTIVKYPVEYIDFEKDYKVQINNYELTPFIYKRVEYDSEKEYRLMIFREKGEAKFEEISKAISELLNLNRSHIIEKMYISNVYDLELEGIKVPIDPLNIINDIVFKPNMDVLKQNEVIKIINDRFKTSNTKIDIRASNLSKKPYK
ncbi:hypothetical protein [Fusibacter bizertensis]